MEASTFHYVKVKRERQSTCNYFYHFYKLVPIKLLSNGCDPSLNIRIILALYILGD